jgi:hypothetical protein
LRRFIFFWPIFASNSIDTSQGIGLFYLRAYSVNESYYKGIDLCSDTDEVSLKSLLVHEITHTLSHLKLAEEQSSNCGLTITYEGCRKSCEAVEEYVATLNQYKYLIQRGFKESTVETKIESIISKDSKLDAVLLEASLGIKESSDYHTYSKIALNSGKGWLACADQCDKLTLTTPIQRTILERFTGEFRDSIKSKYGYLSHYMDKLALELMPEKAATDAVKDWQIMLTKAHYTGDFQAVEELVRSKLGDDGILVIRNINTASSRNILNIKISLLLFCLYVEAGSQSPSHMHVNRDEIRKKIVTAIK